MGYVIFVVYVLALSFILLYSLAQLHLVGVYIFKGKKFQKTLKADKFNNEWPMVTIQLPTYNELYVVERLIDCISQIDYPDECLEIQMLDDSNDETTSIIENAINKSKENRPNLNIQLIRRPKREGYKAGALKYGLEIAKGQYIAIFDADFLPGKSFLKDTIPHFYEREKIGVVQTRWEHINKNYSILTNLQAFGLDAHFTVEQVGRNTAGHFINFNGTGGVWDKQCILDAGNWHADTLTEDLDLSYRAQRKGWQFRYVEAVGTPAELPATMNALKSQQYRWTKGAAENARKNLGKTLTAKLKLGTKIHSFFHLLNSTIFLCIMLSALLSIPVMFVKQSNPFLMEMSKFGWLFLISFGALLLFYLTSYFRLNSFSVWRLIKFIGTFPLFLGMSMGLSLHNAVAVIEGYIGRKTPFVRTPKFNIQKSTDNWKNSIYKARKVSPITLFEGLLCLYFLFGFIWGIVSNDYGLLGFHGLLVFGFGSVFFFSFKHLSV